MKLMIRATTVLAMSLIFVTAAGAQTATGYTLTCKGQKQGSIPAVQVTGLSFSVVGPRGPNLQPSGPVTRQLNIRFSLTAAYAMFLEAAETNEVLTSCTLTWAASAPAPMAAPRVATNAIASTASETYWEFDNSNVVSLTATAGDFNTSEPQGEVEATLTFQKYTFTSGGKTTQGSNDSR